MKAIFILFTVFSISSLALANPVRIIETTPEIMHLFEKTYADRIQLVADGIENFQDASEKISVAVVPAELIDALSELTHHEFYKCGGFIDVTDEKLGVLENVKAQVYSYPKITEPKKDIADALNEVTVPNLESFAVLYSGTFKTRKAGSEVGNAAPKWLAEYWKKMALDAGRDDIKVDFMKPPSGYNQNSVRVTIPGTDESLPFVILGGHLDSINQQGGSVAPGMDDNASGISALTEAYRVMLEKNFRPKATVQIFGYSAEELGLLGSRVIAEQYSSAEAKVRGVMQLDMVAYPGKSKKVTFITDKVNPELTDFTIALYKTYIGGEVATDRCGYACSDHASWTRYGFPSVFPFEAMDMNPRLHTTKDLWDEYMDAGHAAQFSKLAYAFAAELAE